MRLNRRTDAMRALSDLYRIEAERIESQNILDGEASGCTGSLRARLQVVQTDREAMDQEIRTMGIRSGRGGVAQETAWKILTVTFAVAGLAGFLAALWSDPPPTQVTSTLEPLQLPVSHSTPEASKAATPLETSTASLTPTVPEKRDPPTASRTDKGRRGGKAGRGKAIRDRTAKPIGNKPKPPKDDLGFFDDCGMDPMCGFDKKPKK